MWEDTVIALGNVFIAFSLIAAIRDKQKPPLSTSVPTAIIILAFCAAQISLGLYFSTVITFIVAIMWSIIAWQRFRQKKS